MAPESSIKVVMMQKVLQLTVGLVHCTRVKLPANALTQQVSVMASVVGDEEYWAAHVPVLLGRGLNLVGPTLIHWGSDVQKAQYLPRILSADEIWAQGFSEPGAGSDLASLRTRAEDKGDHFLVNGQKVWTSGAQYADSIILLVRTDPSVPNHNGISCLLVDITPPAVSLRPPV